MVVRAAAGAAAMYSIAGRLMDPSAFEGACVHTTYKIWIQLVLEISDLRILSQSIEISVAVAPGACTRPQISVPGTNSGSSRKSGGVQIWEDAPPKVREVVE